MEGRSVWRQVLTVCIFLFVIVRFGMRCSRMNNQAQNDAKRDQIELNLMRQNNTESYESAATNQPGNLKAYHDVFYKSYKYLDSLDDKQRKNGYIKKASEDSLIMVDYKTKFRALKNSFIQNTYDDSLMFAIKTPKNLNIFVHSFESSASVDSSFKYLKRNAGLKNYRLFLKLSEKTKLVCYSIFKQKMLFKGVSMIAKEDGACFFIEFESNKLSQIDLENAALKYIANNIISKKEKAAK